MSEDHSRHGSSVASDRGAGSDRARRRPRAEPTSDPRAAELLEANAELRRQRRRSDTLLELSSLLAGLQEVQPIVEATAEFIRRASEAPFSLVGLRERGSDEFGIAATSGLSEHQIELIADALRTTDRPSLQAILHGHLASRSGEASVGAGMGIAEAMGAPIIIGGAIVGFVAIGAPGSAEVHREDWQDLLVAFAAVTATALARAEAVGELARQRDHLASEVEERTRSLRTALDELRVASDAKTEFLANVSHELRTPLTAILGYAEILASGMDGRLTAAQAGDVETIQASSRHLLELIDDLIDIASIEAGRLELRILPIEVEPVIRDAAATIRPVAGAKGIALEVATRPTPRRDGASARPIHVAADRARLGEILVNLLSNAVKFTPSGGSVRIGFGVEPAGQAVGEAAAEGPTAPAMAAIHVHDSGHGIAPEDAERIFEKFVRIGAPATPGTGLGLPIARELARLHGGSLSVESVRGLGSTFTVRIPLAEPG